MEEQKKNNYFQLMIIYPIIFFLTASISISLHAKDYKFDREIDSIPVIVEGRRIPQPFASGLIMSKPTFIDIDHDQDLDLFSGEEYAFLHFYRNESTSDTMHLKFISDNFLNSYGGNNSSPAFADLDGDLDYDLLLGEWDGNINYFENVGTPIVPLFVLRTENYLNINVGKMSTPAFADIDGDNDSDLFIGCQEGTITFYKNQGTLTNPDFVFQTTAFDSIDIGHYSCPTFVDIDNDSDFDMFVGEENTVRFYKNIGDSTAYQFEIVWEFSSFDLGINTNFPSPAFADIDGDEDLDLFVGGFYPGKIELYTNIGSSTEPNFSLGTRDFLSVDVGRHSAPHLFDIDNDLDLDLFIGSTVGNIVYYENIGNFAVPKFLFRTENFNSIKVGVASTPTTADIDNDGDFDLFVGEGSNFGLDHGGNVNYYENTGSKNTPIFTLTESNFFSIDVGTWSVPIFRDIDADSDLDMFIGEEEGNINFYENTGSKYFPDYTLIDQEYAGICIGRNSAPNMIDFDGDNDLDLFVGNLAGNINYFENTGDENEAVFSIKTENFLSIDVGLLNRPHFADIDADGDYDLFIGEDNGGVHFYRNITNLSPIIASQDINYNFGTVHADSVSDSLYFKISVRNIGGGELAGEIQAKVNWLYFIPKRFRIDTTNPKIINVGIFKDSLYSGINTGKIRIISNGGCLEGVVNINYLSSVPINEIQTAVPDEFILYPNYPNPFNSRTTIKYGLPNATEVQVNIYNLTGEWIATVVNEYQNAGWHQVQWNGQDISGKMVSTGVYFYRLHTPEYVKYKMMIFLK